MAKDKGAATAAAEERKDPIAPVQAPPTPAQEPLVRGMADDLAEVLYVQAQDPGKDVYRFQFLTEKEQQGWINQAVQALIAIDKMNYVVERKGKAPAKTDRTEEQHREILTNIIKDFIGKLNRPKGIHKLVTLFPYEELAAKILAGGR